MFQAAARPAASRAFALVPAVERPRPLQDGASQKAKSTCASGAGPAWQVLLNGAAGRSRTGDLRITNALLYQLSYSGTKARIIRPARPSGNVGKLHINPACATETIRVEGKTAGTRVAGRL